MFSKIKKLYVKLIYLLEFVRDVGIISVFVLGSYTSLVLKSDSAFWKDPLVLGLGVCVECCITKIALSTSTNVVSDVIILF